MSLPRPTYLYLLQWHLKNSFIELRSLPIKVGADGRTELCPVLAALLAVALRGEPRAAAIGGRRRSKGRQPREISGSGREGAADGERAPAEGGGRSREGGRSGRPGAANSGDSSIFRRESGTLVG